jgi:alpha-galactosidase
MPEQYFLDGWLTFHPDAGTLSLSFSRRPDKPERWTPMQGATAGVYYQFDGGLHHLALAGPGLGFQAGENIVTFTRQDHTLHLDWSWTRAGDGLETWLEVTNPGDAPIRLDRLDVLRLAGPDGLNLPGSVSDWRVYQNGWQSRTPAGVRRVSDGPFPTPPQLEYQLQHAPHGGGWRSAWVSVIAAPSAAMSSTPSPHLLFGFVTAADQFAEIILDAGDAFHALSATCYADGISVGPGQVLRSERLRLAADPDGWGSLERWAGRLGELMHARIPERTPTGWCTWYYYFGRNTAQDVYANLNAIRRLRLPLSLVMVDDGYQAAIGDWLNLNPQHYADMTAVADAIRQEGRLPGIWTAPFGLATGSQTWASHPDWAICDEAGQPVLAWQQAGHPVYALDTTHPEAADWLHATFRTMRREWGYHAFKVDFLFAAALSGRRHDPRATRAQALRRGLTLIRDAIGEDAFLLGCGAPLGPAVGLVDGMCSGPDVGPTWESITPGDAAAPGAANALRNGIARAFTHRRLWAADPGCLLVRPRGNNSQLTLYEARTLAGTLALSGGILVSGDLPGDLPPSRLAMLRQALPPADRVAYPLDFFERDLPEILALPIERPWGRWWLVALTNWDNQSHTTETETAALGLPPGHYHVYDQWRAAYLGQTHGRLTLPRRRPHETALLVFKPVIDRPDWLTSTFHLAAGSAEVVDVIRQKFGEWRQKLVVHLEQPGENFGRLVFSVPSGWVVLDAQVNGRRRSVNIRVEQARLVDMGFTLHERAWVMVDFAKV